VAFHAEAKTSALRHEVYQGCPRVGQKAHRSYVLIGNFYYSGIAMSRLMFAFSFFYCFVTKQFEILIVLGKFFKILKCK
jgi:hypothetical protein